MKLLRNAVRCEHCNTVIESRHRHDMVWCNCPRGSSTRVAVDGGLDYCKMSAGQHAQYEDLTVWEDNSTDTDN